MQGDTYRRIVLVDDHVIVRSGLHELIEKLGPYKVTHEFDNGKDFIDALPIEPAPDLVIMDMHMPVMNGDEAVIKMNKLGVNLPVLMLTLEHNEQKIINLFRAGVKGYLEKNCTAQTMKEALQELFSTGYYSNEYLSMALRASDRPRKDPREAIAEQLSNREKELLQLICDPAEYTYEQIAKIMGVVPRTVDGYREELFTKFGIRSKTGLVLFAIRNNLVSFNN